MSKLRYLLVLSEADPIARAVSERLPTGELIAHTIDGDPVRDLGDGVAGIGRRGRPFEDDGLDARLPAEARDASAPIVFLSEHRSERGVACFTTHPLGNPGAARFGGVPGQLVLSAPRMMADALRRLAEAGQALDLPATFEATHHGPALARPAMFLEFGAGASGVVPDAAVGLLARVARELSEDPGDAIAVGIGGGHYAPHFTELVLHRRWAFGHILSRHALAGAGVELAHRAFALTPGASGFLFHRAGEAQIAPWSGLVPRLSEGSMPRRGAVRPA